VAVVLLVLTDLVTLQKLRSVRGYVAHRRVHRCRYPDAARCHVADAMAIPMYLLYEAASCSRQSCSEAAARTKKANRNPAAAIRIAKSRSGA